MVRLHCSGFIFTCKLLPTLGLLALLSIFISLGCWQLQRAHYKEELSKKISTLKTAPALTLMQLQHATAEQVEYHRVQLSGYYDNSHTILLDNKIYQHRAGYEIVTPFLPQNHAQRAVLVNRGWIARQGKLQQQLPTVPSIKGLQQIQGIISSPHKPFTLPYQEGAVTWPWLLQAFDLQKIRAVLPHPVYPFMVLLNSAPIVNSNPQKHYGYAFQWFALALTFVIIYAALYTKRLS